ncbi:hypothetical protein RUND412_008729 [Rhizina undulata]
MASSVFYEGPIEAAIASSVGQARPLVCFVADESEESTTWENVYLRDEEIVESLHRQSVLIKLQAGSTEAGYLSVFCAIRSIPSLIIIKNAVLLANITAVLSRDEFVSQVHAAFAPVSSPLPHTTSFPPLNTTNNPVESSLAAYRFPTETRSRSVSPAALQDADLGPHSGPGPTSPRSPRASTPERTPGNPALSPRSIRDHNPSHVIPPVGSGERRGTTTVEDLARSGARNSVSYTEQRRRTLQHDHAERARILRLLENDKWERNVREMTRRQSRQLEVAPVAEASGSGNVPVGKRQRDETALSFRLLDGSIMKQIFPSSAVLGKEVREWVDENRTDGDRPYSFLQILVPFPNKSLSISDEVSSLETLGLSPTATLVLVPIATFVSAYKETPAPVTTGPVSFITRACNNVFGVVGGIYNAAWYSVFSASRNTRAVTVPERARARTLGGASYEDGEGWLSPVRIFNRNSTLKVGTNGAVEDEPGA